MGIIVRRVRTEFGVDFDCSWDIFRVALSLSLSLDMLFATLSLLGTVFKDCPSLFYVLAWFVLHFGNYSYVALVLVVVFWAVACSQPPPCENEA